MKSPLKGKTVLLGLTGSIAIYKSCELVRRLKDSGADVFCMMSGGAQKFITPLTFSALSGHPVASEIWDESLWKMAHLDLSEKADLVLIAPATAHAIAQFAGGLAGDVISATVLATRAPTLLAPAMHEGMWKNALTQDNVKKLKKFGMHFVGPNHGALSQGQSGWGRLADVPQIIAEAGKILSRSR